MTVIRRQEGGADCPVCGNHYPPSICRCAVNHDPVDCVPRVVEYVDAATHQGAVDALRPFVEAFDKTGRTFCPDFDGPLDLAVFNAAARVLDRLGGQ